MTTEVRRLWWLSEVLRYLYLAADLMGAIRAMLPGISELFMSRHMSVEIWPCDGTAPESVVVLNEDEILPVMAAYRDAIHTSPTMGYMRSDRFVPVMCAFNSKEHLHNSRMYQEVFCPMGWTDQLTIAIKVGTEVLCINCFRSSNFSEDEVEFASIVQRQVVAHFGRMVPTSLSLHSWEIPLSDALEPVKVPPPVAAILAKYFPRLNGESARLPAELRSWLALQMPLPARTFGPTPCIRLFNKSGALSISFNRAAFGRPDVLAVREEECPHRLLRLNCLGLTERQIDVAFWLAQGKTDSEIAELLDISVRTASKHVVSVLAKLECGNRTEAAVQIVRLLDHTEASG